MNIANALHKSAAVALAITLCASVCALASDQSLSPESTLSKLHSLKKLGRECEDREEFGKADKAYLQALDEAKRGGDERDVLEILTLLISERLKNGQFSETQNLTTEALKLTKAAIKNNRHTPDIASTARDLGNAVYEYGERTFSESTKDACANFYADIELSCQDFDPSIMARCDQLHVSLAQRGRWADAARVEDAQISYWLRSKPKDHQSLWFQRLSLGILYVGCKKPALAICQFNESKKQVGLDKEDPSKINLLLREMSQALAIAGNLEDAKKLCSAALQNQLTYVGPNNALTAWDESLLGQYEEMTGKTSEALKHYENAYNDYKKCSSPKVDEPDNSLSSSGLVVSAEEIARLTQSQAEKGRLRLLAKAIRAKHPAWAKTKNPDPTQYFDLFGSLPYPYESISTRGGWR